MKRVLLSPAFLFIFVSLASAVPIEMNYQGYLTDGGGVPVNGTVKQQEIIEELRAENAAFKALICQDHPEAQICR